MICIDELTEKIKSEVRVRLHSAVCRSALLAQISFSPICLIPSSCQADESVLMPALHLLASQTRRSIEDEGGPMCVVAWVCFVVVWVMRGV